MNLFLENLINETTNKLKQNEIEATRFEIRLLLEFAIGKSLFDFNGTKLSETQQKIFDEAIQKRCLHMPVDKIIGRRGFYKYDFMVNEDVLSPRPDTEILLEAAIDYCKKNNYKNVLELGIGSGCILLSLLAEIKDIKGVGVDISEKAIAIAKKNADNLKVSSRLELINIDWNDDSIINRIGKKFDIILSNPPYIPSQEIKTLDKEVKIFDPRTALDGGEDGLDCYRRLANIIPFLLNDGGLVMLECGEGQAHNVIKIFETNGFVMQKILTDLNKTERCIILKK